MEESTSFNFRKEGDIGIFTVKDKRFDAAIAGIVKGEFTLILNTEGISKLVVDLSNVEYCDSSGLSALLLAYRLLKATEGHMRLVGLQKAVKTLIGISQLNRILAVCGDLDEALKELKTL